MGCCIHHVYIKFWKNVLQMYLFFKVHVHFSENCTSLCFCLTEVYFHSLLAKGKSGFVCCSTKCIIFIFLMHTV